MKLSPFGQSLTAEAPIVQLMDDLGEALNQNPDSLFLGGGNPSCVPGAQAVFQQHLQALAQEQPHDTFGVYQSPQGNADVLSAVANYLQETCNWNVGPQNIAIVGGSQTAFFILLNVFAGGGKRVLLPMVPEYLGYGSQVFAPDAFIPTPPKINRTATHRFKYGVDFSALSMDETVGAMCISSPANPSGNVLQASELKQLALLAARNDIPLIVDYAYGLPFPGLVYTQPEGAAAIKPFWQPGSIAVLSLSKLGLPGVRCSIVVANPEVIELVAKANTIMTLSGGNTGPYLLKRMIENGDLQDLSQKILPNYYRSRRDQFVALLDSYLSDVPYVLHEPEGAFFVWLWLPGLKGSSYDLYQTLKAQGVIVMPGEPFFFGLHGSLSHAQECLRLSYCQPLNVLEQAVKIIAREVENLYAAPCEGAEV